MGKWMSMTACRTALAGLRASGFARNLLVVMSGTALAQVVGFALTPVISRLFSPVDFGLFGSFNAVAGVIAAGATLEYSQALMLPKRDGDAINVFVISCLATLVVTLFCIVACLVAPQQILSWMHSPNRWMLALLIVATLVTGFNAVCQAWCVRCKAFKRTSASQVVRSVSSSGAQIGLGCLRTGAVGLIAGAIFADIIATFSLIGTVWKDYTRLRSEVHWGRIKQFAKEYIDFPLYSASQSVINALSNGLPVILLTQYFGLVVAGSYAFGIRLLWAPMSLLVRALRQVLFQRACEAHHTGSSLIVLYIRVTIGLFVLALLPAVCFIAAAPWLFGWLFGPQWVTAGEYSRSLAIWCVFASCNLPAVIFARLIRIQRTVFFYDLGLLALRVAALILGGLYLSASSTIMTFAIVGAVMNLFLILLVGRKLRQHESSVSLEGVFSSLLGRKDD